jgi:pyruvate dehydrogenase E2 component (dihydrolipoamide acetyltransferase)
MATKIILPKLGQTMEEGTIVEWFKGEGDPVERGDALFSVESDKAVLEVEAKAKGVLRKVLVPAGEKVPIMTPVAIVGAPEEDISDLLTEGGPAATREPTAASAPAQGEQAPRPEVPGTEYREVEQAPVHAAGERIVASPRARRVAAEMGVDLAYVAGSGPNGRIIEKDVLAYAASQPKATPLAQRLAAEAGMPLAAVPSDGGRVTAEQVRAATTGFAPPPQPSPRVRGEGEGAVTPMAGVRAVIANRMATSAHTTAAVTLQSVVDATELVALRTRLKEAFERELGFAIGYNDLLAYIVARCLTEFPYMNARLDPEGIRQLPEVNLGLAVDSERGLLVPVIRGAQRMGVKELAVEFRALVARAREGRAQPDDLTGGTFTITNLGMFGVDAFSPIINLPECAILGVGRIRPEPVAEGDQVVVRQRMWLSLTFDHRLVDGAPAARFLQAIMRYIESPYLLLA